MKEIGAVKHHVWNLRSGDGERGRYKAGAREASFVRRLRQVLERKATAHPYTQLPELLMAAAAVHAHMRLDGHKLSKDDFMGWAEIAWERVKEHHCCDESDVH